MKAKLRLKYAARFRNTQPIEEEQLIEDTVDDKEYEAEKDEEKIS